MHAFQTLQDGVSFNPGAAVEKEGQRELNSQPWNQESACPTSKRAGDMKKQAKDFVESVSVVFGLIAVLAMFVAILLFIFMPV